MKLVAIVRLSLVLGAATLILMTMTAQPQAQRGGGGGGMPSVQPGGFQMTRLEILTAQFQLTKDQKKAVKALLDDAHKAAASTREGLFNAHAALGATIAANKGQAEIDAAVKQYGQQAAAMAMVEMKTLGQLMQPLEPAQRGNSAAVRAAFVLMHGIFLDAKKWDAVPDSRSY